MGEMVCINTRTTRRRDSSFRRGIAGRCQPGLPLGTHEPVRCARMRTRAGSFFCYITDLLSSGRGSQLRSLSPLLDDSPSSNFLSALWHWWAALAARFSRSARRIPGISERTDGGLTQALRHEVLSSGRTLRGRPRFRLGAVPCMFVAGSSDFPLDTFFFAAALACARSRSLCSRTSVRRALLA